MTKFEGHISVPKNLLRIEDIKGGYAPNNNVLRGVNLSIAENETVAIIGQNGSGKSTLAKAICNMLPHLSGKIYFDNSLLDKMRLEDLNDKGIGFFMQGGQVFPHLTVEENLELAGDGFSKKEFKKRIAELGQYLNLFRREGNGKHKMEASYLSGGERQQLALGMVIMKKPRLLILDEPSAGLSPGNVTKLYHTLGDIRDEEKTTILLIEQNVHFAFRFSDRISLLKNGIIEKPAMNEDQIEESYFGD